MLLQCLVEPEYALASYDSSLTQCQSEALLHIVCFAGRFCELRSVLTLQSLGSVDFGATVPSLLRHLT